MRTKSLVAVVSLLIVFILAGGQSCTTFGNRAQMNFDEPYDAETDGIVTAFVYDTEESVFRILITGKIKRPAGDDLIAADLLYSHRPNLDLSEEGGAAQICFPVSKGETWIVEWTDIDHILDREPELARLYWTPVGR